MSGGMKLTGMRRLSTVLKKHGKKYAAAIPPALTLGGLFLQRESMKIVPIDTGNLRGGAFTRREGSGASSVVFVGYVAKYAIYVHEDPDAAHKEGKSYKYLEIPLRRNRDKIARIIRVELQRRKV